MNSSEIKEYLHKQIEVLDDRFLKALYPMLQSYSKEMTDPKLSSGQKKELEKRSKDIYPANQNLIPGRK